MFLGLAPVELPLSESTSVIGLGVVDEGWDMSEFSSRTASGRAGASVDPRGILQTPSDSHSTRSKLGFMFKLGQKMRRRFAKGIFVF